MLIDIICILILGLLTFWGWKKGFMRSVFSFLSFFIAIVLAFFLEPPISAALEKTAFADKIESAVYEQLIEKDAREIAENKDNNDFEVEDNNFGESAKALRETAAKETAKMVLRIISILLVVIITKILIHLALFFLKSVSHLPIIHNFDCLLGGVFGFFTAYLIIELLFLFVGLCETTTFAASVIDSLDSSIVGKFLYENNVILHSFLSLE